MATALCRFWGEGNALLCHALTSDQFEPLSADLGWRREVVAITFEWFDTRTQAERAFYVAASREPTTYRLTDLPQYHAPSSTEDRFMRIEDMVAESGISRWTLMKELQVGNLHGAQNKKRGTWRVEEGCFHAWMAGQPCAHQRTDD